MAYCRVPWGYFVLTPPQKDRNTFCIYFIHILDVTRKYMKLLKNTLCIFANRMLKINYTKEFGTIYLSVNRITVQELNRMGTNFVN